MIEAIKQIVEALEWCHGGEPVGTADAIAAGKKLIAELESQGKTMKVEGPLHVVCQCDKCKTESQEPVAWYYPGGSPDQCTTNKAYAEMEPAWIPLYTHPPQRKENK